MAERRIGGRRARNQAEHVGGEIARARAELALTQAQVSRRANVSPDTERRVEQGDPGVQLDTLCAIGEAVGLDIVVRAYRGRRPTLRDTGQLALTEILCSIAAGSWEPRLEVTAGDHGEAIDLCLFGATEIIDAEIERMILDFQDQYRRLAAKRDWLAGHHQRPVRLVMVIEDTERNRAAVAPHAAFIKSVLPGTSRDVLTALRSGKPLRQDALLWIRRRQPPRR